MARRALLAYGALVPNDRRSRHARRASALSMRLNDAAVAAQWFERAAAASNDVRLLTALADAQLRAGDRDAAEATIARGLERDRTTPPSSPSRSAFARGRSFSQLSSSSSSAMSEMPSATSPW
jgi:thioredoxin-like negative regulator of GroEL